ncbi:MAG: hypothetical protein RL226_2333 [Bacteroidota bacterium]|jgi:hypothetical protein
MKRFLLALVCLSSYQALWSQGGVEDVYIEEYFVSDVNPFTGEQGKTKTYRIYIDLAEGFTLQAVFGKAGHPLFLRSSAPILNQTDRGSEIATWLDFKRYNDQNLYLDSYLTMAVSCNAYCGVPLRYDTDGTLFPGLFGDQCPAEFVKTDGLMKHLPVNVQLIGLDASAFGDNQEGTSVATSDGCWALLGSVKGATPENMVLIAQITTTGELSFELNLQLGGPDGLPQQYVARNAKGNEILCEKLIFPKIN